jgi:3-oxoacyl-[acyl-carrier protein] reductase
MDASRQLDGRTALVTGGSRGIGAAIARALLDRGARVAIGGRQAEALSASRSRLARAGDRFLAVQADVRDPGQVGRLITECVARLGGLDILINNAGVGDFGNVADQSIESWRTILDTNLSGVFYCCREAIPHLRARGGGWIINISSLASTNPFAGAAAYCASKAGLNAFSEALMQEVRFDGIRVSCVLPGSVRTEFSGSAGAGTEWKLAPEDVAQAVVDLLLYPKRSLPSRVELRPSMPRKST